MEKERETQTELLGLNYAIACGFKLHRDLDPGGDGHDDEPSIMVYVLVNCIIKIKSEQQQRRRLHSKIEEIHFLCDLQIRNEIDESILCVD